MKIFRLFAIVLLYVVSAFAARQTEMRRIGPRGQAMQKVHTDRVLVELVSPLHRSEFRVLTPGRGRFKNVVQVEVSPPFTPEGFIARLKEEDSRTGQRRIKRAELSPVVTLRGVPNDRFWRNQWYFGADQGFQVPSIGFYNDSDLDMSHGLVYVADTGCPAAHEDLDPETIVDKQKFVDDNFPGDLRDRNGHGTAVIGIMAAKTNNGVGIASMTPDVKVGCVQALDEFGEGDLLGLINMLDYVSSLQSQRKLVDPLAWILLNLSLGGYGHSELLEEAKDRCSAAGVIIVAAAGNNGFNLSRDVYDWFCSKSSPYIIVVGASDLNDQPANFGGGYATNYGSSVDVFAPGVGIAALGLNNTYVTERGTSFATPLVTSTVALMLAKHPDTTPKAIKQRLANGDPFKGRQVGVNFVSRLQYSRNGVRLNLEKALSEDLVPPTIPLLTMSRVGHASVYQEISVSDDNAVFGCEVLLADSEGGEFTRHGELVQNFVKGLAVLNVPVEEGKVYYRAIQCFDTAGNASELSLVDRIETPVSRTLSQYEGGSTELTVLEGPTAPLFPAKLGRPSGLLWKPLERQWVVSGEEISETDAGDNHLKIPIDLTQVSGSADTTVSVTLEGEFTVLSSDFRSLGDSSAVQRSEGLLELWVLSPDLPNGGAKLADIPNNTDAQTFDASLVLRYPGASLSIRTFVDGNRGAVKLRTVTVRVDEK